MLDIPMRSTQPLDHKSIFTINVPNQSQVNLQPSAPNQRRPPVYAPDSKTPTAAVPAMAVPPMVKRIQKGQKILLDPSGRTTHIEVCLGWNVTNPQCDLDVSAFLLGSDDKVLGDDWFVFYGQEYSPDQSVHFASESRAHRESISVDFTKLHPQVRKLVFVLTINEALAHHLNFSMVKDAYIQILNADTSQELVSFQMTDYYPNVISMMIGEIYLYNGKWKCSAIGNGVARDLAGLCELYGVQVI